MALHLVENIKHLLVSKCENMFDKALFSKFHLKQYLSFILIFKVPLLQIFCIINQLEANIAKVFRKLCKLNAKKMTPQTYYLSENKVKLLCFSPRNNGHFWLDQ